MCCHEGVQKPMGSSGKEVEEETQPHLARQIPLLVGAPREIKDAAGIGCTAIDVIYNPWVTRHAEHNTIFKSQIVDLAMLWIHKDYPDIKFDTRWKTPNSKYKGGTGPKGNQPLPFPMDLAVTQSNSDYDGVKEGKKEGKRKQKGTGKGVDALASPASLLAETRRSEETPATRSAATSGGGGGGGGGGAAAAMMNIKGSAKGGAKQNSASLIQEMDKNGQVIKKKKKKTKKKAVTKGFLNSSAAADLYGPEGSNETGFVTGRPKKGALLQ